MVWSTIVRCYVELKLTSLRFRYERYGHTLNAVDTDGDGKDDIMILLGGYASSPSNDVWVTTNGVHWV